MSRGAWRGWLLGAVAYLLFLWATLPAPYLAARLEKRLPQLQLAGVTGTVFAGAAGQVQYQGNALGAVQWRFDWLSPLRGTLGYRITLDTGSGELHGRVATGFGRLTVRDLTGRLPVSALNRWLPLPPDSVDGSLVLQLKLLNFKAGHMDSAAGSVDLNDAVLKWPAAATLGSFHAELTPVPGGGLHATLADVASPFKLQAAFSLGPDGAYHVSGTLAAHDPGDSATRSLLANLGPADSTGQYPFDFSGRW